MVRKLADVAYWLGISVYFGGMLVLGAVAAPAVFSAVRQSNINMPGIVAPPLDMANQVGGEIFGAILNRFGTIEAWCLGFMLAGIAGWIIGHRHVRRSTWVVLILWAMVAALASVDSAWLRPKVWSQRQTVRTEAMARSVATAPTVNASWPARDEFDKLHHWSESVGRLKVYVLLGMLLVAAWRGLADKRGSNEDKRDVFRRVMGGSATR